ncbi:MAG: hypothetical protein VX121_08745, partial [Pseudomonadota bacterium]|nr:hypothetical protein [Pseudomonadota bacterium]
MSQLEATELEEWTESLDAVLRVNGPAATSQLLAHLSEHAQSAPGGGERPLPPPRVLLLSSKHNASGTNLQCADHVVFVEPPGTNKH